MKFQNSGKNYRQLIGGLNYLSCTTRPDITFLVNSLSQYLNKPGLSHWKAALKVLQYLTTTPNHGLVFKSNPSTIDDFYAYADADYANCPNTRRSITGYLTMWNGNILSWRSRKQPTVSVSVSEAEVYSVVEVTKEIMWIKILFNKIFNIRFKTPTIIWEDNQGAIGFLKGETNHSAFKTKHMDVKNHFIRREIKIKKIEVKYIQSNNNLADFMTKPLCRTNLKTAISRLKMDGCSHL